MEYIPAIISAIGTIIAAWFAYNQYAKNKLTDLKIEKWKEDETKNSLKKVGNMAVIYGELWEILHEIKADRVYIVQPHPLVNYLFVSISAEVKRKGISSMRDSVQNMPMSEVANFVKILATEEWQFYKDVEREVKDKKAKAIMSIHGTKSVAIRRLVNHNNEWIGSLFIESANEQLFVCDDIEKMTEEAANSIQFILPPIK